MYNRLFVFPIALVVVIIDQISKYIINQNILIGEQIVILNNILSFLKAYNTGAAFSFMQNKVHMLAVFSLIVIIIISVYLIKKVKDLPLILILGWGLILGGTIGNLIDRVMNGYVIDFIKLDFIHFPIFNVADMSINIGAILVLGYLLYSGKKQESLQ